MVDKAVGLAIGKTDLNTANDKIIGFALSLGKQDRTATGNDFSGDVDTTQYTLSSYGALHLVHG
jgi:hypothetical protein